VTASAMRALKILMTINTGKISTGIAINLDGITG
jgi:hypothetical protein